MGHRERVTTLAFRLCTVVVVLSLTHLHGLHAIKVAGDVVLAQPVKSVKTRQLCSSFTSQTPPPVPSFVGQQIEPNVDTCFPASKPIPVLGVAVLHDAMHFLTRLIYSIDYPVESIIIAYNGHDARVASQAHALHRDHPNIALLRFNRPQSCAEGWNAVIQAAPNASWYLLPNYDIFFPPGQLRKLAHAFQQDDAEQALPYCLNCGIFAYSTFAVKQSLVQRVGLFDENLYPAFWEDDDWQIRLGRLAPPARTLLYQNIYYIHGLVSDHEYTTGQKRQDRGSAAVEAWDSVFRVSSMNRDYMARKWGCKFEQEAISTAVDCTYTHPFNNDSLPVSYWHVDREARRQRLVTMYGHKTHRFNQSMHHHFNTTEPWTIVDRVFDDRRRKLRGY